MAKGIIRNRINKDALKYVVERIQESGHVINGAAIAKMIGVDKGTISRGLHAIGIPCNGKKYENSMDAETRTHEEIARVIREAMANGLNPCAISSDELVARCGLRCSPRMARNIMKKYGIPRRRRGKTKNN
jgi:hypothetical protein